MILLFSLIKLLGQSRCGQALNAQQYFRIKLLQPVLTPGQLESFVVSFLHILIFAFFRPRRIPPTNTGGSVVLQGLHDVFRHRVR